ncbi:MAG: PAS domain S-box protein [Prolixibacteraceae bacterium]|nr:PAS domain S-box protein [Prolixibacteraceae bacterium]
MEKDCKPTADLDILRQKAEKFLKNKIEPTNTEFSEGDIRRLLHELNMYHIELEMQNEELKAALARETELVQKQHADLYDSSGQKRAEIALRESEERLRNITENAPNLIIEVNRQGQILFMNSTTSGYRLDEVIGRNVSELSPLSDYDEINKALNLAFSKGLSQTFQSRGLGENSEMKWYQSNISPVIKSGEVKSAIISVNDITDLVRAEERRQSILNTAMDGFAMLNIDGYILEVNDTYCQMTGYSKKKLLHKRISELMVAETEDFTSNLLRKIMEKGEDRFETQHRRKDGSILDVEVSLQYQPIDGGQFIAFMRDITARKWTEGELTKLNQELERRVNDRTNELVIANAFLQEAEEKYRTVADHTYGWEYWTDQNGDFLYCSPSCERITGYTVSDFTQNPRLLHEIIHPEDLKHFKCHKQKESKGHDGNHEINYRIVRTDGSVRWIGHVCQSIFDKKGNLIGTRGSNRDITERKNIEQLLKTNNQKYKLISENITDGVFICKEGCFEYVNKAMANIFGYGDNEIIGMKLTQLVVPDYLDEMEIFHKVKVSIDSIHNIEIECFRKDLSIISVEFLMNYIAGENVIYGVVHDITDKRELQKNIVKAIIKTEEKERAYFSKELHDGLGPLLSTIKLYLQWSERPNTNARREEIIHQAEGIIEDALTTVKEISNKLSPHLLTNHGLSSAIQSFAGKVEQSSNIRIDFESDLNRRLKDEIEAAIYRATIECINNSIKHSKASNISILINDADSQLLLHYRDDGIGFNLEETLARKKGLGLFNLQNRIQTIGGKISMFSKPGQGVDYQITISL